MTNGDLLKATAALERISGGGHTDATEMRIYRALRSMRPVAADVRRHLRAVMGEYTTEVDGETVWTNQLAYQEREAEVLALPVEGLDATTLPIFRPRDFKKLPGGAVLADLGPLFVDDAGE